METQGLYYPVILSFYDKRSMVNGLIPAAATPSNCKMDACSRLIEDVNYSFPCGEKGMECNLPKG